MTICACGCGQEIPWKEHHSWKPPKYIPGHQYNHSEWREIHRREPIIKPPPDFNPSGFCECGCGQRTIIAQITNVKRGQYKGYPIRFIHGHSRKGKTNPNAKGFKIDKCGYKLLYLPDHHLANGMGYVVEHRLIWEETNGRRLKPNEEVHHIDGDPANNSPENLVALTKKEHRKLHSAENGFTGKKEAHQRRIKDPEYHKKQSERITKWWAERKAKKENENGN